MPVISTCEHRLPWESRCRVVFLCPSLKGKEKIASHSLNLCVSSGAGGEESPINWSEERGQANYSFSLDFGLAKEQERLRHYRRFVHEKGGIEDVDQRSVATGRKTGKAKGRDDGLMRAPAQLRIYYFTKLPGYFGFPRSGEPLHIFLELLGLEDSVFTQRSGPSWIAHRGTLS
jgi:hypothetical protein